MSGLFTPTFEDMLAEIDWSQLRLLEREEIVRELSADEEAPANAVRRPREMGAALGVGGGGLS